MIKWQPDFNFIDFWPKLLPQCTLPQSIKKLLKPVPINRSSHDLHDNRFASKKELYVTTTIIRFGTKCDRDQNWLAIAITCCSQLWSETIHQIYCKIWTCINTFNWLLHVAVNFGARKVTKFMAKYEPVSRFQLTC